MVWYRRRNSGVYGWWWSSAWCNHASESVGAYNLRWSLLPTAYKPLILLDFHRSFNDIQTILKAAFWFFEPKCSFFIFPPFMTNWSTVCIMEGFLCFNMWSRSRIRRRTILFETSSCGLQPIAVPARIRRNKIQAWKTRSRIIQLSFRVIPCGDSWLFARTKRRDCTRKTAQAIGRSWEAAGEGRSIWSLSNRSAALEEMPGKLLAQSESWNKWT